MRRVIKAGVMSANIGGINNRNLNGVWRSNNIGMSRNVAYQHVRNQQKKSVSTAAAGGGVIASISKSEIEIIIG